jgi:lysophospholipase L1-like esterase
VIVNSGINDVRNAPHRDIKLADPRTLLWEANMSRMRQELANGGPSLWTRLVSYSYLVRLPGYIRARLQIRPSIEIIASAVPQQDAVDYFASNIRKTAELSRSVGADVIFSTPASSLSTKYHPHDVSHRGYWIVDATTTEAYRMRLAERLESLAIDLSARGRPIPYVFHELGPDLFLDDCHLTSEGNRAVALRLVDALAPLLDTSQDEFGLVVGAGEGTPKND